MTLYWFITFPMLVVLALLIFEAAYIVYAKQTAERYLQAAAQAGLATARLVPQGVPVIAEGNRVTRVDIDLSNVAIQLDRTLARRAVVDTLKRNFEATGWGTSKDDTQKPVRMDINRLLVIPLSSRRTDSIIFSKALDRPRTTYNDDDVLLLRGEITVRTPLVATFYNAVFKRELGVPAEITMPVEAKAQIRFRVGQNINTDFPPIEVR